MRKITKIKKEKPPLKRKRQKFLRESKKLPEKHIQKTGTH
jgi:hypothetical protein